MSLRVRPRGSYPKEMFSTRLRVAKINHWFQPWTKRLVTCSRYEITCIGACQWVIIMNFFIDMGQTSSHFFLKKRPTLKLCESQSFSNATLKGRKTRVAYHLTENFGNSGWKVNGTVTYFRKFQPKKWGVCFEVVRLLPLVQTKRKFCLPLTNFSVPSRFQTLTTQIRPFFGFKP